MKITWLNINRCLYGIGKLPNRLSRAKYFRGHSVHSPFVYSIVRQVFMKSRLAADDRTLYDALLSEGVPAARAVQLQNLYAHCGYSRFGLNGIREDDDFVVLTREFPAESLRAVIGEARHTGATVAVMAPYDGKMREAECRAIVAEHRGTTIDNRGYLLVFNNGLPKQHFRL